MALPAMYAQQAKGTLMPGQMIAVNKYNVQVERYLSQGNHITYQYTRTANTVLDAGGFAHVYLVRTAEPVFNTTHHVLKRMAVASEEMLNEVKKEVDIMVRRPVLLCAIIDYHPTENTARPSQYCVPH